MKIAKLYNYKFANLKNNTLRKVLGNLGLSLWSELPVLDKWRVLFLKFDKLPIPSFLMKIKGASGNLSGNISHYQFKWVNTYRELSTVASELKLCSSGRFDLVKDFLMGKLLRFAVYREGEIVALICVHQNRDEIEQDSIYKRFKFYGLVFQHESILKPKHLQEELADLKAATLVFKQKLIDSKLNVSGIFFTSNNIWES